MSAIMKKKQEHIFRNILHFLRNKNFVIACILRMHIRIRSEKYSYQLHVM